MSLSPSPAFDSSVFRWRFWAWEAHLVPQDKPVTRAGV